MHRVSCLAVLIGLSSGAHADTFGSSVDAYISRQMNERRIPGLSVEVIRSGHAILQKGYGYSNLELHSPVTSKTVYRLMSVGKQFTATAVLILVQRGKISLDGRISEYVGDLPPAWQPVTIRQLLTHTSGIPEYTSASGWSKTISMPRTPKDLLEPVADRPLEFAPGSRFSYSNSNYFLLGLAIEKASGETWERFLSDEIFRPLGMRQTFPQDGIALIPNRASGYHLSKDGIVNAPWVDASQIWAAGSALSNVEDLGIWDQAQAAGTLLPRRVLDAMTAQANLADGSPAPYGFGNELELDHGHRVAGHQGSGIGFNATYLRYPDDRVSVIVLTNLTQGGSREIARHIAAMVIPALSDESRKAIVDDEPALSSKLRQFVVQAALGKVDLDLMADSAKAELVPFITKAGPQFLGPLGTLKSFELLDVRAGTGGTTRRYRVRYAGKTLIFAFTLTLDGRILSLEPTLE